MTLFHIWASPGPVDSGTYLAIIGTWVHSYIPGPHLDLVTVVLIWTLWDLVFQFPIGASPGPSDSRPTLGLTLTW